MAVLYTIQLICAGVVHVAGINKHGAVIGALQTSAFKSGAFFHDGMTLHHLGTLGGENSAAKDINDTGTVVGWAETAGGLRHAFIYDGSALRDVGRDWGDQQSSAIAINSRGMVIGARVAMPSTLFSYSLVSAPRAIPNANPNFTPLRMNTAGLVVGSLRDASGEHVPASWREGQVVAPLGPSGRRGGAMALNDVEVVVGWSSDDEGGEHGFLYSAGEMATLRGLRAGYDSVASEINQQGDVVGLGYLPGDNWDNSGGYNAYNHHAVLWSGTVPLDLNDAIDAASGWLLQEATAINEQGQIAGIGLHGGQRSAYLLTPITATPAITQCATPIPVNP